MGQSQSGPKFRLKKAMAGRGDKVKEDKWEPPITL
jgi:hypothetical protein